MRSLQILTRTLQDGTLNVSTGFGFPTELVRTEPVIGLQSDSFTNIYIVTARGLKHIWRFEFFLFSLLQSCFHHFYAPVTRLRKHSVCSPEAEWLHTLHTNIHRCTRPCTYTHPCSYTDTHHRNPGTRAKTGLWLEHTFNRFIDWGGSWRTKILKNTHNWWLFSIYLFTLKTKKWCI